MPEDLNTEILLWNTSNVFSSTLSRRNSKTQQLPVVLEKAELENPRFHWWCFPSTPHKIQKQGFLTSSSSRLNTLFARLFEKVHFRDGLVWTEGQTVQIKLLALAQYWGGPYKIYSRQNRDTLLDHVTQVFCSFYRSILRSEAIDFFSDKRQGMTHDTIIWTEEVESSNVVNAAS